MKEETYYIRRLSKKSIREAAKLSNGKQQFYKIVEGTFPETQERALRIRPNAAFFAKRNEDVYAVLHKENQKEIECLFLVKYVYSTFYGEIAEVQLCRCLGKCKTKGHYALVRDNLTGMASFLKFHENDAYDFTIYKK